jgi:hypothetical protein
MSPWIVNCSRSNKKLHYKRYGQSQHRQATGDGDGKAQNKHIDLTDRTSKQREKDIDQENDDEHGCRQFQSHHEHVLKEAKDIISHSSRERSAERRNSLIAGKNRGHQKQMSVQREKDQGRQESEVLADDRCVIGCRWIEQLDHAEPYLHADHLSGKFKRAEKQSDGQSNR